MISFSWWPILLLLPVPWLVRKLLPPVSIADSTALQVPYFDRLKQLSLTESRSLHHKERLKPILLTLIWCLLLSSAAKPTWLGEPVTLSQSGRDLILAVDVSNSMEVQDFKLKGKTVDRLTAVKSVLNDFINRRKYDRIGLILFGSQAYIQTPLTLDRNTLKQLLNEASISIAGPKTAIGDAVGLAIKRLQTEKANTRILILLTDGANTAGELSPKKAAELAAQENLKIYTIGMGATEIFIPGPFGFGTRRINPSQDLDESSLKTLADKTGGRYFRAEDIQSLEEIYKLLDQLEPVKTDSKVVRPQKELFYWPLTFALLLHVLLIFPYLNHWPFVGQRINK